LEGSGKLTTVVVIVRPIVQLGSFKSDICTGGGVGKPVSPVQERKKKNVYCNETQNYG